MSSKEKETTVAVEEKEEKVIQGEASKDATEEILPIQSTKPAKGKSKSTSSKEKETTEGPKPEEIKDPVMDFEIDPSKTYVFKLTKEVYRYMIPSQAHVWDEINKAPKKIVLTDTEDSPYEEDHSEYVKGSRKQLSFVKGELKIKGTDAPAIRYLLAFDGFKDKSEVLPVNKRIKGLYYLEDIAAKEAQKVQLEIKRNKAKGIVLEASSTKVESFVLSRGKQIFGDAARLEALKIAGIAPDLVIEGFEHPVVDIKADLMRAQYKGLIRVDGDKILTGKKEVLYTTNGRDILEEAAKEILGETAKGKALMAVLAQV